MANPMEIWGRIIRYPATEKAALGQDGLGTSEQASDHSFYQVKY